jgi:hypothetical protein
MENIQILCIFQTPLEKAMCAIRRKSVFSVLDAFLISTSSRLKIPHLVRKKITFPNLLHK